MKSIGHFINGKEISGKSDRRGKVFNPATGEVQAEVAYAEKSELDNAVELAKRSGFTNYRRFAGGQYESVPF